MAHLLWHYWHRGHYYWCHCHYLCKCLTPSADPRQFEGIRRFQLEKLHLCWDCLDLDNIFPNLRSWSTLCWSILLLQNLLQHIFHPLVMVLWSRKRTKNHRPTCSSMDLRHRSLVVQSWNQRENFLSHWYGRLINHGLATRCFHVL